MRILMLTNTYSPHVGGVARSVTAFAEEHRRQGHLVLVVAPHFPEDALDPATREEEFVVRVPAVQHWNGSDFSFPVPIPVRLRHELKLFGPQIIHSHHPFLLGDTALRIGAEMGLPVVFTHHTLYERYTHYMPGDSTRMQSAAIDLAVGYCNLCDAVIAPSGSIADLLVERGVTTPIEAICTGVDLQVFSKGEGLAMRRRAGIPSDAFVVGHVGRLAPEKSLGFLSKAVAEFVAGDPSAWFLVAGEGPSKEDIEHAFGERGLASRLVLLGNLEHSALADAYHAMDVFAFASRTETQGMVLTEAMAAGVPVVALDAPGAYEVVEDGINGRLLPEENQEEFVDALRGLAGASDAERESFCRAAWHTAEELSLPQTAHQTRELYRRAILDLSDTRRPMDFESTAWHTARRRLAEEWKIVKNLAHALGRTLIDPAPKENR